MMQLSLTINQVNIISLAATLGGQMKAEAIGFKLSTPETEECSIQSLYLGQWKIVNDFPLFQSSLLLP